MKKKLSLLILLIILALNAFSQQTGRIETDRPDQTECPFIVKKGFVQGEVGFNRSMDQNDVSYLLPTALWKIGIHKNWELRYTTVLSTGSNWVPSFATESFGFKTQLIASQKSMIPKTAIIVQYHWNNEKRDESERNKLPHSLGETIFTFQNNLNETFGIGYNLGLEYHSNGKIEGIYRFAPNMNIGKNGYAYVELFGRFPKNIDTEFWGDVGVAYYVSEDVKVDFSIGKSWQNNLDWYAAVGCSFRLKIW